MKLEVETEELAITLLAVCAIVLMFAMKGFDMRNTQIEQQLWKATNHVERQ